MSGEIFLPGFGASGGAGFQGMSTPAASQREALLQQLARQTKREQLSDLEADPGSEDAEAVQTDCRWRVSVRSSRVQPRGKAFRPCCLEPCHIYCLLLPCTAKPCSAPEPLSLLKALAVP